MSFSRWLLTALLSIAVGGCGCGAETKAPGGGDADTDTDTDTDADTDSDSDTGSDTGEGCDEGAFRCRDAERQSCDPDGGWTDDPCPADHACVGEGECIPEICTPAETRCNPLDASEIQTCAGSGTAWLLLETCEAGFVCVDGACEPVACEDGEGVCAGGGMIRYCNDDGTDFGDPEPCPDGFGCEDGECIPQICVPGEGRCIDAVRREECNEAGTGWFADDCGAGRACDDGTCRLVICPPGLLRCADEVSLQICNDLGTEYLPSDECDDVDIGEHCVEDHCATACDDAALNKTSVGCVFYGVDMNNADEDPDGDGVTIDFSQYAIVVANPDTVLVAEVDVERRGAGGWVNAGSRTLDPNELYTFDLADRHVEDTTVNAYGAYRVTSTAPIIAYQFQPIDSAGTYSNDASLLIPRSTIDLDYYVPAWHTLFVPAGLFNPAIYYRSSVAIVITEDDTDVTITSPVATLGGGGVAAIGAGGATTVRDLDETDVIQIEASGDTDLSGLVVNADKPVTVFGGVECGNIPDNLRWCDHVEEQIFPLSTWGTAYVAARVPVRGTPGGAGPDVEPSIWRIMAGDSDVTVSFDYDPAVTGLPAGDVNLVDAGDYVDYVVAGTAANPGDFEVTADKPILVVQYVVGQESTDNGAGDGGDPDMVLAVPTDQYLPAYIFLTPDTYNEDYVIVVRPTGVVVTLDGLAIPAGSFIDIGAGTWQVARVAVGNGVHEITADEPFGITAEGYSPYVSYGYPGGMNLAVINPQ